MKIKATRASEKGSSLPLLDSDYLWLEAVNVSDKDVVLKYFTVAFSPSIRVTWNLWEVSISLLQDKDWVTIKPGQRYLMSIPIGDFITTAVSAETSIGRQYNMSLRNRVGLRLTEHKRLTARKRLGFPMETKPPPQSDQIIDFHSRD
ncbi:hypothetical protein PMI42_00979 [Bradyrhizobium sp. YR681]|uniref:hypothetical protein n=1 Tax=Bradyrhizobium sp. YR681 TaxID=1144344 RepID=UPI00027113C3|nr:hypothetical protein [Bradyrhizobium sp. YR681]EJN15449.1 hypothetical protein PMI42_00979 [Bradyrhizobium sp. YR681]